MHFGLQLVFQTSLLVRFQSFYRLVIYSAVAKSVMRATVNRVIAGSSPAGGAICSISLEVKHDLAKVESPVRVWYIAPIR